MKWTKVVTIILAIIILGPLIFMGSCTLSGFALYMTVGEAGIAVAVIIGILVTVFVMRAIIKDVTKKPEETEEEQRKRGIVYDPSRRKNKK